MNTVSLQSFQHEKAIICCKEEEINGVCLITKEEDGHGNQLEHGNTF